MCDALEHASVNNWVTHESARATSTNEWFSTAAHRTTDDGERDMERRFVRRTYIHTP